MDPHISLGFLECLPRHLIALDDPHSLRRRSPSIRSAQAGAVALASMSAADFAAKLDRAIARSGRAKLIEAKAPPQAE
jgi:hypothetical protein